MAIDDCGGSLALEAMWLVGLLAAVSDTPGESGGWTVLMPMLMLMSMLMLMLMSMLMLMLMLMSMPMLMLMLMPMLAPTNLTLVPMLFRFHLFRIPWIWFWCCFVFTCSEPPGSGSGVVSFSPVPNPLDLVLVLFRFHLFRIPGSGSDVGVLFTYLDHDL